MEKHFQGGRIRPSDLSTIRRGSITLLPLVSTALRLHCATIELRRLNTPQTEPNGQTVAQQCTAAEFGIHAESL